MKQGTKKTTVYFEPEVYRALRKQAAEAGWSFSALVNDAVRCSLTEDAQDLATFEARAMEPDLPFEDVVRDLREQGGI